MILNKTDVAGFALFAHRLADAAGDIAQRFFQTQLTIEGKADGSPVTQADRAIEQAMVTLIRAHYPDHGIFGEETGKQQEEAEWLWVLDPIDGTRAFIAGQPTFVTLIALCHRGIPIIGLIDQPIRRDRWLGIQGQPTLHNGQATACPPPPPLAQCTLATTSHPYFTAPQAAAYDRLHAACAAETTGLDGYSYGLLTKGVPQLVADAGLKPYDFCALAPVIAGAGGVITDWNGESLTLYSDGTAIAAPAALHRDALACLRPLSTF